MIAFTEPAKGIDTGNDFSGWILEELQERANLVSRFDLLCDQIVEAVQDIVENYDIIEKTFCREETRRFLVKKEG